mmetsp:Transcript_12957/g.30463  ORF Transcript_12957/g.30463 Transcript_12957/m.30463 type:complete len:93 (+) Transcript_12957:58-336(+)
MSVTLVRTLSPHSRHHPRHQGAKVPPHHHHHHHLAKATAKGKGEAKGEAPSHLIIIPSWRASFSMLGLEMTISIMMTRRRRMVTMTQAQTHR